MLMAAGGAPERGRAAGPQSSYERLQLASFRFSPTAGGNVLAIPGGPIRVCEGLSRREWLRIGGLGALGLSLADLPASRALSAAAPRAKLAGQPASDSSFGRAKSCILLFMFGAPAHQDTWDLKPEAPREMRGEFQPIASNIPGIHVGEHLPRLAGMMDRLALIRSVTHPDNTHTVAMHYMLTGVRHLRPATNPRNAADDFPCFGAVVNHAATLREARGGSGRSAIAPEAPLALPAAVSLNAPANQVSANNHIFPGFFAGFLGSAYDPLFVSQNADAAAFQPIPAVEGPERLADRQNLLHNFERQTRGLERSQLLSNLSQDYANAFSLLTSTTTRDAFDLSRERPELRARYGQTPFGQGCLLARRLVERGVSLVTVNWERDDAYWDTHKNNFSDLKQKLLPNLDRGFSALLEDMSERGMLDETLIVWMGEFGRTPQINQAAGRDHWAPCNSVLLAGAGLPGGVVYGASDRLAAYPTRQPVPPQDLSATIYHLLGIDRHRLIHDQLGRPLPLSAGEPVWDLL